MSVEGIIEKIEHQLRDLGVFPMADTPETIQSRVHLRVILTAFVEHMEVHYAAREGALLRALGGDFSNCSAELLERASVMLALAAMRASPSAVEPNRADELEKRLGRAEALIEALIGPQTITIGPTVFRSLDGTRAKTEEP